MFIRNLMQVYLLDIKNGKVLKYGPIGKEISADQILLDVRFQLLSIATVEQHKVKK